MRIAPPPPSSTKNESGCANTSGVTVSPMSLLQNPMILLAVVGFGLMVGMPYLIDSSTFSFLFLVGLDAEVGVGGGMEG